MFYWHFKLILSTLNIIFSLGYSINMVSTTLILYIYLSKGYLGVVLIKMFLSLTIFVNRISIKNIFKKNYLVFRYKLKTFLL